MDNYKSAAKSATVSDLVPGAGGATGGTQGSTGGNGGTGTSGGDDATPTTIQTAVPTAGNATAPGDAAQTTDTPIPTAGTSGLFVPSTLLLVAGAAFMLL